MCPQIARLTETWQLVSAELVALVKSQWVEYMVTEQVHDGGIGYVAKTAAV